MAMIYYVSADASGNGCGSKETPFQTIGEAAAVARARAMRSSLPPAFTGRR